MEIFISGNSSSQDAVKSKFESLNPVFNKFVFEICEEVFWLDENVN